MYVYTKEDWIKNGSSIGIFATGNSKGINEHKHDFIEIVYVRSGNATQYVDGERFDVVDGVLDCFSGDVSDQSLSARLELLLEVGASSGSDILCGMLFAFYLLLLDSEEI